MQNMGINDINGNPALLRKYIEREKEAENKYYSECPDSLIPLFEKELRDMGFEFEISSQTYALMPKYKKELLPLAVKYYQLAKKMGKPKEQEHFTGYFVKGCDEVLPMLLCDYYSEDTTGSLRWRISDCFYIMRSKKYVEEYLDIVSNKRFGHARRMIVLLLGKLKEESAIPILIELLEDEEVRLQAICALGFFKRKEFRCYFERFENSNQPAWRKYARTALKKLDD